MSNLTDKIKAEIAAGRTYPLTCAGYRQYLRDTRPREVCGMYTEFRKDGWPLCPCCGEDELWSSYNPPYQDNDDDETRKQKYISLMAGCYRCSWKPSASSARCAEC